VLPAKAAAGTSDHGHTTIESHRHLLVFLCIAFLEVKFIANG